MSVDPASGAPVVRKKFWRTLAIWTIVLVAIGILSSLIDVHRVHLFLQRWPGWAVFVVLLVLPLCGFPVSVLHVVAGMRWGPKLGLGLVACSIFLQLLASYGLVYLFRDRFARRFAALRKRIPPGAHGPVTLFTLLLPGVPYFAKNYVLPIAGVPFRTYLFWAFPIHAVRSSIAVLFGHESDHLTPGRIAGFAAYALVIMLSCAWAFRRLRAATGDQPRAEDGPTPPE